MNPLFKENGTVDSSLYWKQVACLETLINFKIYFFHNKFSEILFSMNIFFLVTLFFKMYLSYAFFLFFSFLFQGIPNHTISKSYMRCM